MQKELLLGTTNAKWKLDPRTKIILALSVNVVMISGGIMGIDMIVRIIMAFIPALLLLSEGKYKISIIYLFAFTITAFCEMIILKKIDGAFNIVILVLTGLISRFIPGLITGYYLVTSTSVSEFIASMEKMHVTDNIVIPISVMFRFFPTISEEMSSINDAMTMRGIGKGGTVKSPIAYLEYKLVPLMMSVVKIGEELSAASLTKGLGSEVKRTNICSIGYGLYDIVFSIVAIAGLVVCILF